jgi:hypothetical protein
MPTMFDPAARERMRARLRRLAPDARARWGRMSAPQMIGHLKAQMRDLLGELPVRPVPGPLRNPLLRRLVIDVLPWPRGVPTAPEYLAFDPGDWTAEVAELERHLETWVARGEAACGTEHPAFGRLDGRMMGRLLHRHWNHHLTQFGV